MKRPHFIFLFFCTQVLIIFLMVYKHTLHTQLFYERQKQEFIVGQLLEKKDHLTHHLYALQDKKTIKTFAKQMLNFKPITLSQIKKIQLHG